MSAKDSKLIWLFGLFCLGCGLVTEARAEIHGLIIGIDDYFQLGSSAKLDGAVNDAEDLAATLKTLGAPDVVLLRNAAATREKVTSGWQRLVQRSKAGDLLMLAFAGHGTQEPERVKGSEADGLDEVLLLAGYSPQAPYNQERLPDDDIALMLDAAAKAGLRVIFIADACHSGTMTRGVDSRVRPFKVRALPKQTLVDDRLPPPNPDAARMDIQGIEGVLAFGAVQDHELAPESLIDGHPRGALSWAMAKALRGEADLNGDGQLADDELTTYVREIIRARMEGQQHPTLPNTRGLPLVLLGAAGVALKVASAAGSAWDICKRYNLLNLCAAGSEEEAVVKATPVSTPPPSPTPNPVTLGVNIRSTAVAPEEVAAKLQRARLVTDGSAVLTWDFGRGEMLNALGDVVAYLNDRAQNNPPSPTRAFVRVRTDESPVASTPAPAGGIEDLPRAQRVIDKWLLIEGLKKAAERRPLRMSLNPDDALYSQGKEVTISVGGMESPYLTLFNLASDGTLNFLYPLSGQGFADPLMVPMDRPHSLRLRVEPPFGADHFVALVSSQPLTSLHTALAKLEKTQSLTELESVLRAEFVPQPIQLGIHGVYTCQDPCDY